jgi:hypothetical protein
MFRDSSMLLVLACSLTTSAVCGSTPPAWLQALGFGGSGDDIGHAVAVGVDGSQCFAGEFSSSVQFASTQLVSFGGKDAFLAKRDLTGAVLWAVQAGGSSDDWAQGLALDSNDNIYLTGEFYNSATFGGVRLAYASQVHRACCRLNSHSRTPVKIAAVRYETCLHPGQHVFIG